MRYREDKRVTNAHGQIEAYTLWIGGPTLSSVTLDHDGKRIKVAVTGEADTFFSLPAQHRMHRKTVRGWLGHEDGKWQWHPSKT